MPQRGDWPGSRCRRGMRPTGRCREPPAARRPARVGQRVVRAVVRAPRRALGVQEAELGQALGLGVPLAGRGGPDRVLALAHHAHEVVGARAALADQGQHDGIEILGPPGMLHAELQSRAA